MQSSAQILRRSANTYLHCIHCQIDVSSSTTCFILDLYLHKLMHKMWFRCISTIWFKFNRISMKQQLQKLHVLLSTLERNAMMGTV